MKAELEKRGWKSKFCPTWKYETCPGYPEYWTKQYPNTPSCGDNPKEPGVSIQIAHSKFSLAGLNYDGYEIEICAKKPDGMWCRLISCGIGEELPSVLDSQIEQLLTAWKALNP